jgi:molybdenum cofactor cytidylyltransferase
VVAAIILAAGKSERMGRPKALLPIEDSTFLERILKLYAGSAVGRVVVVLRGDGGPVPQDPIPVNPSPGRILTVANPDPEGDQLSSLLAGIAALEPFHPAGAAVHPVDHPLVLPGTVELILDAAARNPRSIVIPVCRGRRGHPVVFPSGLFGAMKKIPPGMGARAVLRDPGADVVEVVTDDAGILADIDTPEDYERIH